MRTLCPRPLDDGAVSEFSSFALSGIQKRNYTVLLGFCVYLLSHLQKRKEFMKKTLLSVGSLLLVSGMLGSAALAAFLPAGRFNGMEFRTSNLALLVDPDFFGPGDFRTEHFLPGAARLYPGMQATTDDFMVKNSSDQGQALKLTGKVVAGNNDWNAIKDVITMSIFSHNTAEATPEYTLAEWSEEGREFPYSTINANTSQGYQLRFSMLEHYPFDPDGEGPLQQGSPIAHELMNKSTQNVAFVISGEPTDSR